MKTLALISLLVLHATGLWPHLNPSQQDDLARTASGRQVVAVHEPASVTPALLEALPVPVPNQTTLNLPVAASIAVDNGSGAILYAQDPNLKRPIASVTKMATALVILSRHNLADTLTIPELPSYNPEDERIGLVPGEQYTVSDLLRALLIQSANDAADALAIADSGGIAKFCALMNAKMSEWGITGTRFISPSGLVDTGNYATADALTKVARLLLVNPFIRQIISEQSATITSTTGRQIILQTTNQLLYGGDFYGIKTGYTVAAGECFVGLTRINGHEVITVVLGATDRFGATKILSNWITRNWQWL